jgi:hypothetical protein
MARTGKKISCALIGLLLSCCLIVVSRPAHSQAQPSFDSCTRVQTLANSAAVQPLGTITRGFVQCFGDLLVAMDPLLVRINADRLNYAQPTLDVYRAAVSDAMQILEQGPDMTNPDNVRYVDAILSRTHLIDEIVAYATIYNAPPALFPDREKGVTGSGTVKSAKELITGYVTTLTPPATAAPGWLKNAVGGGIGEVPDLKKALGDALEKIFKALDEALDALVAALAPASGNP